MRRDGVEREAPTSLYDLRRSVGHLLTGPRFKVGVLGEGYAWMPETLSFAKVSSGRFGKSKSLGSESVRELPRVIIHASRGRVFSYSSYFMLKGHSLAIGFSPNRRASSKAVWTMLLIVKRPIS